MRIEVKVVPRKTNSPTCRVWLEGMFSRQMIEEAVLLLPQYKDSYRPFINLRPGTALVEFAVGKKGLETLVQDLQDNLRVVATYGDVVRRLDIEG